MKPFVLATSVLLLAGSGTLFAQSALNDEDIDVLLGAAAGAAIGSTIGDGDGQRIATALGGLIGAGMARDRHRYRYAGKSFESFCRNRVPAQYRNNLGVTRSWVEGCVVRLEQRQAELEQSAFEEALHGSSN